MTDYELGVCIATVECRYAGRGRGTMTEYELGVYTATVACLANPDLSSLQMHEIMQAMLACTPHLLPDKQRLFGLGIGYGYGAARSARSHLPPRIATGPEEKRSDDGHPQGEAI